MNLVINASPLILLGKVGQIDLLRRLCDTVCVPEGVVSEIEMEKDDPACHALRMHAWLKRVSVSVPDSIKAWDLGCGESEVVAYALEQPQYRPLLDDAEGKACALAFGLKPLGTGGLLVLAKRAGLLSSVHPVLRELRTQGFWISDGIIQTILHLAGESTAPCDEA